VVDCTTVVSVVRMTSLVDDPAMSVSQDGPTIVTVDAEPLGFSQMGGPSLEEFIAEHGNLDEMEDSQDPIAEPPADTQVAASEGRTTPPPRKKRKRMTFANKFIVATREVFLLPEFYNQFTDGSVKIHGKTMKCATRKDLQSRFVVE